MLQNSSLETITVKCTTEIKKSNWNKDALFSHWWKNKSVGHSAKDPGILGVTYSRGKIACVLDKVKWWQRFIIALKSVTLSQVFPGFLPWLVLSSLLEIERVEGEYLEYLIFLRFILLWIGEIIETFIFINLINLKHVLNSIKKADLSSLIYCLLKEYTGHTDIQSRDWDLC